MVKPEKGRTARQDKELADKLQVYKRNLSREEINKLVEDTKSLLAYQEEESPRGSGEDTGIEPGGYFQEIAPICNEEKELDGIKMIHHNVETNGIGYITLMFDLSGVPEEKLVYAGMAGRRALNDRYESLRLWGIILMKSMSTPGESELPWKNCMRT